jgi:hypothetical protein
MPRQKLVKLRGGMIGNPAAHVGEPSLRVGVVELGRGDQRVHRGGARHRDQSQQITRPVAEDQSRAIRARRIPPPRAAFSGSCEWPKVGLSLAAW